MSDNLGILVGEVESEPHTSVQRLPEPRCPLSVRVATLDDLPFIDGLQKIHTHMVGWFPKKQMEQYIEGSHVLIAEGSRGQRAEGRDQESADLTADLRPLTAAAEPLGYCIYKDQYMKRDDLGIIYQLNVLPLKQRNLIGATLVQSAFERAAYGCRLFCCWCAQDIRANWFWESIGFVPLAFRTGSRGKQRTHIFWQRRVREDEQKGAGTPYWFPYQTQAGAMREDRLVLPIPPDTHWRDAKPLVLPDAVAPEVLSEELPKALPGGAPVRSRPEDTRVSQSRKMAVVRSKSRHLQGLPAGKAAVVTAGGIRYVDRGDYEEEAEPEKPKKKRAMKPRAKHDPKLAAYARELRDRFLEQVNTSRLLPESCGNQRYDVSRQLAGDGVYVEQDSAGLLEAA